MRNDRRWYVQRTELSSKGHNDRLNSTLERLLNDGWEPFAAQHTEFLHENVSLVWLRKQVDKDEAMVA